MARAHGSGTLVKRGKYYTAKWMVKGKLYTRSTRCTVEREAKKKLEEFTKPFRENSNLEVIENLTAKVRVAEGIVKKSKNENEPPVKLDFLVDTYKNDLSTSEITDGTESAYNSIVNQLKKATGKELAHEVTKDDATAFMKGFKEKVGARRYNCALAVLRMLFSVAMKHDYRIRCNPFDGFAKLKVNGGTRRELTDEEVKKLREEASKSKELNGELGLLFDVAIYTGLRLSDCCNLKWSSIDLKRKLITALPIKTKKNGREAKIPLHQKLNDKLAKLKHDESGFVMPTIASSRAKTIKAIGEVFSAAGIATNEKGKDGKVHVTTGFHALRHYFISQCVKSGIPVSVVQQMVAHSSADMSLAYTHTFDSDLQLPDYDSEYEKVSLKKTTVEALEKAKGVLELDDFIMALLKGKPTTAAHAKTKQQLELEEMVDSLIPEQ